MLFYEYFFMTILYLSYILIIVSYFGLIKDAPDILNKLNNFINLYTSIFLIYTFNPLKNIENLTKVDQKIIFNAGFIIILTSLSTYIANIEIETRNIIQKELINIINIK